MANKTSLGETGPLPCAESSQGPGLSGKKPTGPRQPVNQNPVSSRYIVDALSLCSLTGREWNQREQIVKPTRCETPN